jgi:hypothetical protein
MTRLLTALGLVLTAAASFGLYQVKYQVQDMERNLASMKRQIVRDRAEMQVLDAEWSFLNKPERLQGLASRYLALAPIRSTQMASIESLPPRGAPVLAATPTPGQAIALPPASAPPAASSGFSSAPSGARQAVPAGPETVPTVRSGPSAPVRSPASALMISGSGAVNEDITPISMGGGE